MAKGFSMFTFEISLLFLAGLVLVMLLLIWSKLKNLESKIFTLLMLHDSSTRRIEDYVGAIYSDVQEVKEELEYRRKRC